MLRYIGKCAARLFISVILFSFLMVVTQNSVWAAGDMVSLELRKAGGTVMYQNRAVTLVLNGQQLPEADMPPIILQDRTYVPLRHVFEAMGAIVDFHDAQRRILIAFGDDLIVMYIGQYHFDLSGVTHQMDVAPQIINDRTMVPVSFVASAMGFDVGWDSATFTVTLTAGGNGALNAPPPGGGNDVPGNGYYGDEFDLTNWAHNQELDFAEMSKDVSPGRIGAMAHAQTVVSSVGTNQESNRFVISATSAITSVDWFILSDGRLVVDIFNAMPEVASNTLNVRGSLVRAVRVGHQIIGANNVARVVFDLEAPIIYSVELSANRRDVVVTLERNIINSLNVAIAGDFAAHGRESIVIDGCISPVVDVFLLDDPLRLVIDVQHSVLGFDLGGYILANSHFVEKVRYGQFDENTVRIVVDLLQNVSFAVEHGGNRTVIQISEPTYRNITFDRVMGAMAITKPHGGFDIGGLVTSDQYLLRRYSVTLPGDFSGFFGYGTYAVRGGLLSGVEIVTRYGLTTFYFNTRQIMAFIITQDEDTIFVRPVPPREKYPFVVFIDPGHGGTDPGAVHGGMREADVNLDVANMVLEILRRDGIVRAYTTRYTDVAVPNAQRAQMANEAAHIFVSIHHNAANGRAHGTETLYAIHNDERGLDFNSHHLAQIFQDNLVDALGSVDRGARYRPRIIVLNQTRIPAVLVEVGFMDNPQEAARIATQEHRRKAAQAIVNSIYEAFEIMR